MPAIDTSKGRYYPWKGHKFVSVTTVISEGIPKPQLNRWMVRNMAETAAIHRELLSTMSEEEAKEFLINYRSPTDGSAARLGSMIHSTIERIINGRDIRKPTEAEEPYIKGFNSFVKKRKPIFLESESSVYSLEHGYAGTMDALVVIDGKTYVMDTKTGKSVWPETALQLAAYRYADFFGRIDGREDPIPPCDGGFVLHLGPNGYRVVPFDTGPEVFDTFLSALDIFRWTAIESSYVIKSKWR